MIRFSHIRRQILVSERKINSAIGNRGTSAYLSTLHLKQRQNGRRLLVAPVRQATCHDSGFSLVELLVVIGIIGLLVGLTLPAIHAARESARKIQCANNLKQIGDAYHSFESFNGRFPPIDLMHDSEIVSAGKYPIPNAHSISAHFFLLPELNQTAYYNQFNFTGDVWVVNADPSTSSKNGTLLRKFTIAEFACPSDDALPGDTNYLICFGTSPSGYTTTRKPDSGSNVALAGVGCGYGVPTSNITDGLSQTVAFAERIVGDKNPARYVPARDWAYVTGYPSVPFLPDDFVNMCSGIVGPAQAHASFCSSPWLMAGIGTSSYNHLLTPNSSIPDCSWNGLGTGAYSARSRHGAGAFILMTDGAVKFANESIDLDLWRAIGTMDGSEPQEYQ